MDRTESVFLSCKCLKIGISQVTRDLFDRQVYARVSCYISDNFFKSIGSEIFFLNLGYSCIINIVYN